jgi:hypothetical protein
LVKSLDLTSSLTVDILNENQAMINMFCHVIAGNGTQVWLWLSTHEITVCAASAAFLLFIPLIAKQIT